MAKAPASAMSRLTRPLLNRFMLCLSAAFSLPQDQLSADMYSFVAKEIDYANYFQTVRVRKGKST